MSLKNPDEWGKINEIPNPYNRPQRPVDSLPRLIGGNPHFVTKQFEYELCRYTGAKYAVVVNSCTMALLLAVKWHIRRPESKDGLGDFVIVKEDGKEVFYRYKKIDIPCRTYVSVPMSIIHAGGTVQFRDEDWGGMYQLKPYPIWDSARRFTSGMYIHGQFQCVSFHASKILGDTQGGAILHDNDEADAWFRRMRFDGRTEGVAPKDDDFREIGYHCYLSVDIAARLLQKLSTLPLHNADLPNSEYPDLSLCEIFK